MAILSKKEIAELSKVHDKSCISIFIPTHRAGQEVLQQQDSLALKNQLKDVSTKLKAQGFTAKEIKELLLPAEELMEDKGFWRHQSDGLAIFIANGFFHKHTLPIRFEAFNYVSNEFYLKPLMPMFAGDGRFFILSLNQGEVNFYEGSRHSITEVYIDDLTPSRLEERVGFDYKEKSLQFRSQQEGQGNAIFHGQGANDEDKNEILRYFRAINDGLMTMLHDETPPMVVACLDHLFPIYQKVNDYKEMLDKHISGNPSNMDWHTLHEKAWSIVQPHFDKERQEKIEQFKQLEGTQASSTVDQVVPAALNGKVDTLFLQNSTDIWGIYQPEKNKVEVHKEHNAPNVSLMNLAAINVFQQGGKVYLMEEEDMPDSMSEINALYRY